MAGQAPGTRASIPVQPPPPAGARPLAAPGATTQRRRLSLLLGVLVAVLAFAGVFALGSAGGGHAVSVAQSPVLIAARTIQAREVLAPGMFTTTSIPTSAVPAGAVVNFSSVKGATALVTILQGQYLTTNVIGQSSDQPQPASAYLPIPQGFVARAIPTGELQGVAGYPAVGDYINVIATVNTSLFGDARGREVTKLVFPDLHIIRIGPATPGRAGQSQGIASSLTVVMTICDAEMMDWMIANAKLTYLLLSYHDYISPPSTPDPACPSPNSTNGIGPQQVNSRYSFTSV